MIDVNTIGKIKGYVVLERVTYAWKRSSSYRWYREDKKVKYFDDIRDALNVGAWQVYAVINKLSDSIPLLDEDIKIITRKNTGVKQ